MTKSETKARKSTTGAPEAAAVARSQPPAATRAERLRRASRERRESERHDLRRAILDSAAALFLEEGYESFSMRQVAERIGYSATTIYRHFDNKDALLFAVVDAGFARFGDALAEAAAADARDGVERVLALGRAYVRFGLENPAYYRMMFLQRSDYLRAPAEGCEQPRASSFDILRDAVQRAIDEGTLVAPSALQASNFLWALVHGVVALALAGPNPEEFADLVALDTTLELAVTGLRAR